MLRGVLTYRESAWEGFTPMLIAKPTLVVELIEV
jgi:hypothetical protein